MIIDPDKVSDTATQLLAIRMQEQTRLSRISKYMRGRHDPPYAPKGANSEYRWIMRKSVRNFLPLVVSVISQNLHVDGYHRSGQTVSDFMSGSVNTEWDAFRANRMVSRQHGIHRSVAKHGIAYVIVLPGQMAIGEEQGIQSMPVIRPVSARRLTAMYLNDVDDEWPQLAVEVSEVADTSTPGNVRLIVTLYDEQSRYILTGSTGGGRDTLPLTVAQPGDPYLDGKPPVAQHGLGVCPVVRFLHETDLDGELDVSGEVEPIMLCQDQINFSTFNLMMAEQYAAFRQRWVTGMAAADEEGREVQPFRPGVDRMFASDDPTTKFGEFDVTPLQPYIDDREAGIRHMSTISQVPPYHLLGQVANMSAEALAAARDGLDRKIEELQAVLTDPHRNVFRLSSKAVGDMEGWNDLNGTVVWRDTSARAFAATVDALGKLAQMLDVPVEELWRRVPGATADDVESWLQAKTREEAEANIQAAQQYVLAVQSGQEVSPYPPPPGQPPAGGQPPQPGVSPNGGQAGPAQLSSAEKAAQRMLAAPPPGGNRR